MKEESSDSDDDEEGKLALALAMSEELTTEAAEALCQSNSKWKHAFVEPPATVEAPRQTAKLQRRSVGFPDLGSSSVGGGASVIDLCKAQDRRERTLVQVAAGVKGAIELSDVSDAGRVMSQVRCHSLGVGRAEGAT